MTHWNYRVLSIADSVAIHEVHYDEMGMPVAYGAEPVTVGTDTIEGLKWMVERFIEALAKPMLTQADFDKVILP